MTTLAGILRDLTNAKDQLSFSSVVSSYVKHIQTRTYENTNSPVEKKEIAKKFLEKASDFNVTLPVEALADIKFEAGEFTDAKSLYQSIIDSKVHHKNEMEKLAKVFKELREYDSAAKTYMQLAEIDGFVWSYIHAAQCWSKFGDFKQAEEIYKEAIRKSNGYDWARYSYASALIDSKQIKKGIDVAKSLINDESVGKDVRKYAKEIINTHSVSSAASLEQLGELIDNILSLLKYDGDEITHYTGLSALQSLINKSNPSEFRISEASFLNDPTEGLSLFDFFSINIENKKNNEGFVLYSPKPFVGSFVDNTKTNNLTLWRMYAKEMNADASGCAITFSRTKLLEQLKGKIINSIENKTQTANEYELRESINQLQDNYEFYHVVYLESGSPPFAHINQEKLSLLIESIESLGKILAAKKVKDYQMMNQLKRISFLFKKKEFSDENEVRLIIPEFVLASETKWSQDEKKIYAEIGTIVNSITKITLAPRANNSDELMALIYHALRGVNDVVEIRKTTIKFK